MADIRQSAWRLRLTVLWLTALAAVLGLAAYSSVTGQASWEAQTVRGLQAASPPPLELLAEALTAAGGSTPLLLTGLAAAGALLYARHRSLALLVVAALALRALSPIIKDLIERPRPSPAFVDVAHQLNTYSFPSGHVLGATLLYGSLAYAVEVAVPHRALRRACQATLVSLIALMGYARMELGEHWPTDVMGGWLIGALLVSALVWLHTRVDTIRVRGLARDVDR